MLATQNPSVMVLSLRLWFWHLLRERCGLDSLSFRVIRCCQVCLSYLVTTLMASTPFTTPAHLIPYTGSGAYLDDPKLFARLMVESRDRRMARLCSPLKLEWLLGFCIFLPPLARSTPAQHVGSVPSGQSINLSNWQAVCLNSSWLTWGQLLSWPFRITWDSTFFGMGVIVMD